MCHLYDRNGEKMKKCIIITSYIDLPKESSFSLSNYIISRVNLLLNSSCSPFIICADGGYANLKDTGIVPDLIIGDFDSYSKELPEDIPIVKLPVEKDDTDTGMCIRYALNHGMNDITIIGGIGGRLDHTIANIQLMAGACENGAAIKMLSPCNEAYIVKNDSLTVARKEGFSLSVFSLTEHSYGVSLSGLYYPLDNTVLTSHFPLGVSNSFTDDEAVVTVKDGMLLVICSGL